MNFTKTVLLAACLVAATNNQIKAGVAGAVVVGAVAGWSYEKLLYNLPILLSLPGVCVVGGTHALANGIVTGRGFGYQNAATVSGLTSLAAMVLFYMMEKDKVLVQKEERVVIVQAPYAYPVNEEHRHHHHGHESHHHKHD